MGKKQIKKKTTTKKTVNSSSGSYSQTYYFTKKKKRSVKPTLAGMLLIVVGVIGLVMALFFGGTALMFSSFSDEEDWFGHVKCSFLGEVTDEEGIPIEGVTISLLDEGKTTTTNEDGRFIILNLPMGFEEIRIEKDGYITQQYQVFLSPNDNMNFSEFDESKEQWLEDREEWLDDQNDYYSGDDDFADNKEYDYYGQSEKDYERENNYRTIRMSPGTGFDKSEKTEFGSIFEGITLMTTMCFGVVLISSLLTLGGGVLAIMRKGYGLAIVGCIAGIFTLTFPINLVLCVIAFFVLILSYEEFHSGATNKPYRSKKKKVTWKGYEPPPPY